MKVAPIVPRLLVLVLTLLVLAPFSMAHAAAPQSQLIPINFTFDIPAGPGTCSFDVVGSNVGFLRITSSVDQAGNPVMTFSYHAHGAFTNPANGLSVPFIIANTTVDTLNPDGTITQVSLGLQGRATIPGQGLVAASVGRLILTLDQSGNVIATTFEAGQFAVGPFPTLCPYLA